MNEAWRKLALGSLAKAATPSYTPVVGVRGLQDPEGSYGEVAGSGTFLTLYGAVYLLTCEHVVDPRLRWPFPSEPYDALTYPYGDDPSRDAPAFEPRHRARVPDLAMGRAARQAVEVTGKMPLAPQSLGVASSAADGVLYVHGALDEGKFLAGLYGKSRSALTVWADLPSGYEPSIWRAIEWPSAGWVDETGAAAEPPRPSGLSGSLLWQMAPNSSEPRAEDAGVLSVC